MTEIKDLQFRATSGIFCLQLYFASRRITNRNKPWEPTSAQLISKTECLVKKQRIAFNGTKCKQSAWMNKCLILWEYQCFRLSYGRLTTTITPYGLLKPGGNWSKEVDQKQF